ncbi:SapC family protein [Sphingobium baderi]|uniref:Peptidase n=1 Tax=Sphingobium baderi TaxID=1332080 RepID=A0A0S3EZP1_9SPHN|nr:SapC family protein [Sphingobium baderi]ALR20901.1 peptidase [Sphingobium baderi]
MTDQSATTAATSTAPRLPLFYKALAPLHIERHADWRLAQGDASFAAEAPYVPIVVGELAQAARDYPIVFAAGDAQPIAILGLERRNLFIEDGRWIADAYVPAYVRRYPFGFLATMEAGKDGPNGFALAIDTGSDRVLQTGSDGAALFENGAPSALTKQALDFCNAFQAEARDTMAFANALREQNLLVDRRADATLPDGRKLGLEGFQVIDPAKYSQLPDEVVLEWHNNGYLPWINFHMASLDRFTALLNRQALAVAVAPESQAPASADPAAVPASTKSKKVAS